MPYYSMAASDAPSAVPEYTRTRESHAYKRIRALVPGAAFADGTAHIRTMVITILYGHGCHAYDTNRR